ncbi:hypothetical protein JCM19239_2478 [Vibrio variabilis]|uniref:Polysaccharide pyruvyl transferase domain-containing protein n=1 Tax=Vibrio variabilis TaxID=990271 RepID=A0ABQ0JFH3_9VIBR|nr:hypothetical protein JCM19239_2478 [Vibrio variabilis]
MSKLNVLHIASFSGNIGDNANHRGFRNTLENNTDLNIEYQEYEIRQLFRSQKPFDSDFVALANQFDLLIFGGGNYFELWVERSATGTSIDIELELLDQIKAPIVFNGLGVDPAQGASRNCIEKFRRFLDYCIARRDILLSCRNDGSLKALQHLLGPHYANAFYHVPDTGFYCHYDHEHCTEIVEEKRNIVIQVAGDMLEKRYCSAENAHQRFITQIALVIEELAQNNNHVILVPHIYRDLAEIYRILEVLPDETVRERVTVAPYLVGDRGSNHIMNIYAQSDLVIAMRFHANVCAIGFGRPCIPLINYPQIEGLCTELDITDKIYVDGDDFAPRLCELSKNRLLSNHLTPQLDAIWFERLKHFHKEISELITKKRIVQ